MQLLTVSAPQNLLFKSITTLSATTARRLRSGRQGWAVAQWAVASADAYDVVAVSVDGQCWDRSDPSAGWTTSDTGRTDGVRIPRRLLVVDRAVTTGSVTSLRGSSVRTVHCDCEGCANVLHADVRQSAKAVDEHRNRHALDRVQIDCRAPGHRIVTRLEYDLAGKASDNRRAGGDQDTAEPRYRGVAGQNDDRAPTDLGELAPPHFSSRWQRAHDAVAARRNDARSPHSSGSSSGCWS